MENGALIGGLAIFTIGAALVLAIGYFGYFLRTPRNREAAHKTLVRDETSATLQSGGRADGRREEPLKKRLDNSESSSHPDDPTRDQPAP